MTRSTKRAPVDVAPRASGLPRVVVTGARVLGEASKRPVLRIIIRNTTKRAVSRLTVTTVAPKGTAVTSVRAGTRRARVISWPVTRIGPGQSLALIATLTGDPASEVDADQVVITTSTEVAAWERPLATPIDLP